MSIVIFVVFGQLWTISESLTRLIGFCCSDFVWTFFPYSPPLILRPGGITLEQLQKVLPSIQVYSKATAGVDLEEKPPTPGLKYRHYSPTASLILFEGNVDNMLEKLVSEAASLTKEGKKVGIIRTHPSTALPADFPTTVPIITLGDGNHPLQVAQGLFAALRSFDDQQVEVILMEGIEEKEEGLAVMNRARKAASQVVQV